MGRCFILKHNTPEPVLSKGPLPILPPNVFHFGALGKKTTLSNPITPRTPRIPRAALTGKGITRLDITISPIGMVLA